MRPCRQCSLQDVRLCVRTQTNKCLTKHYIFLFIFLKLKFLLKAHTSKFFPHLAKKNLREHCLQANRISLDLYDHWPQPFGENHPKMRNLFTRTTFFETRYAPKFSRPQNFNLHAAGRWFACRRLHKRRKSVLRHFSRVS